MRNICGLLIIILQSFIFMTVINWEPQPYKQAQYLSIGDFSPSETVDNCLK